MAICAPVSSKALRMSLKCMFEVRLARYPALCLSAHAPLASTDGTFTIPCHDIAILLATNTTASYQPLPAICSVDV